MKNNFSNLALELIEKEKKDKTSKLDLGNCGLVELPKELFDLTWLRVLIISNEYYDIIAKKRIFSKNEGPPNKLIALPKEFAQLKKLKKIVLSGFLRPILQLEMLGQLSNLRELYLANSEVKDISFLSKISHLEFIDLSHNLIENISSIPSEVKELDLGFNIIKDITPLEKLNELEILNLNKNQIEDINALAKLLKLQALNISDNIIISLAPLRLLDNLIVLDASHNRILDIYPLAKMRAIKNINLDKNPIANCPPEVWQTNDLSQIRAYFESMQRPITKGSFWKKGETEDFLADATRENYGPSKSKPPAKKAVKPKIVIRDKGILEESTKEIVEQNELVAPPSEIEDVKLVFVGNSGSGKTQLSEFLEKNKLNKKRQSTHGIRLNRWLPNGKVSPAFLDLKDKFAINIWDFGGQEYYHGTFRLFLSNYAVYILLWETPTNENALLATEVEDGTPPETIQHFQYKYWLDNIRHYAPTSPILIVQNKIDRDERKRVDTQWIEDYLIQGDHYISLHQAAETKDSPYKWSFDLFCNELAQSVKKTISENNAKKSTAWLDIRDAVVGLSKRGKKKENNPFVPYAKTGKYIELPDFEKACLVIEPELTESELYTLPRWLHNCGIVIYFGNNEELNNRVYLDPIWVTSGIYSILDDTVRKAEGQFEKKALKTQKGLDKDTLIALMEQMEIIFEKSDQPGHYIAPQYLPETHPIEDLYAIAAKGLQQKSFYVKMPLFFFRKVLQRMIYYYGISEGVTAYYYWKQGILFEREGTRVMFKGYIPEDEPENGIFLIGAEEVGQYLAIQKEVFHLIFEILENKELRSINVKQKTEQSDLSEMQKAPTNIKYKEGLKAAIANFTSSIKKDTDSPFHHRPTDWTSRYQTTPPPRWLRQIEVSVDGSNFVHYLDLCQANRDNLTFIPSNQQQSLRIHDFQVLLDRPTIRPLKIFCSYSHRDTELMNQLSVHLAPLRRLEKVEVWNDQAIQPGDQWETSIENNLKSADIILFLISADFVASEYIWNKEIPMAMAQQEAKKAKVIPIYLRPFDYNKLAFTENQIIPKTKAELLLPITRWEDRDQAFLEVAQQLRSVIENWTDFNE